MKLTDVTLRLSVVVLVILLLPPVQASAEFVSQTYSFNVFSNNNSGDAADAEANIFMRVSNATTLNNTPEVLGDGMGLGGVDQALFEFFVLAGAPAMSVTDVYFDDGTLLGISDVLNVDGETKFSGGSASPPNLPGGSTLQPQFQATAGFLADSDPAVEPNGVGPGEIMGVLFDLGDGKTILDVFAAISNGLILNQNPEGESLRVGIRIQGFESGGSEAAILVPEATGIGFALLAISCAWIVLVRKPRISSTRHSTSETLT